MEPNLHTDADKYQAGMGGWSKNLAPLFIEFIGGIKDGDRVLDVGCGTGSLTFTIADTTKASTVVGIDPSVGYLEYARAHNTHSHASFLSPLRKRQQEKWGASQRRAELLQLVWDNSGGLELAERFWDAAIAVDPGAKRTGDRRCGSPSALSDLWTATGFANVETQVLKERLRTDILGNRPDGSIMLRARAWAVRGVVPAG